MSKSKQSLFEDLDHLAVKYNDGAQPNHDTSESNSRHQRLARLAIVIGGCTIVVACLVGFLSFQVSREMLLRRMAQHNLAIARTVACYVDEYPPAGDAEAMNLALERIREFWYRFESPTSESFLCVVNRAGEMVVCTSDTNMEGRSVLDLSLEDPINQGAKTLGDLLNSKRDFWGEDVTLMGEQQVVGFAYSEALDHGVLIHFPTAAINRQVVAVALPWSVGIVIITLFLTPLSLGLLYRSYSSAQRIADKAEHKLQLQAQIVESMSEGINLIRPSDGIILYCNPQLERMFGYEPGELVGQHVSVINAPGEKSPEETVEQIISSLNESGSWSGEIYNIKKDGTHFWTNANVTILKHPDYGQVWVTVQGDITERKRAEEALRVESKRKERILAGAMDGFVTLDLDGRFCDVNEAYCAIIGYSRDELLGMSMQDVEAQETAEVTAQQIKLLLKVGHDRFESKQRRQDGCVIDVEVSANLVDLGGQEQICSFIRDITYRKQTEKALQESEIKFRTTFESAAIAMTINDINGRFIETNPAFQELFGYTTKELAELNFTDITHPEDKNKGWKLFKQLASGKLSNIQLEKRYICKDGSVILAHTTGSAIKDSEGRFRYSLGMVQDITVRKQAERAVRISEARLNAFIESAPVGMVIFDDELRYLKINKSLAEINGLPVEEHMGKTMQEVVPHIASGLEDMYHRILTTGEAVLDVEISGEVSSEPGVERHWITSQFQIPGDEPETSMLGVIVVEITDRKRAEEAVTISESRFRGLFEAEPDGVIVVDGKGIIQLANAKTEEMFGYAHGELVGKPVEIFVPQRLHKTHVLDRAAYLTSPHARAMGTDLEVTGRRKDGSEFPADVSLSPLETDEGLFVMSIIRDITERKQAEAALRDSEERFRVVFEKAPSGMAIADADGKSLRYNSAMQDMLGYSEEELRSMDISQYTYADDVDEGRRLFAELREGKRDHYQVEKRYIRKDGKILWGSLAFSSVHNDQGEVQYLIATVKDITERKLAEADRLRLAGAVESAGEAIMITDTEGIIQYVNPAFTQINGYSPSEAIGKNPRFLKSGKHSTAFYREMWDTLLRGEPWRGQFINRKKGGELYDVDATIAPVHDSNGQLVNYVAVVRDITERKRAEEQARQLQVELAHMSRLSTMGEMASGLAHELNQPLTVIANYANGCIRRIHSESLTQDELKEMLERISAQARRGGSIIRGLESLVRKSETKRVSIDINESILEIVDLTEVDAKRHKATTRLELKPKLPSVMADPTQVQQVILNLVQNACEACEKVPVSRRVVTIHTARASDDELEITISDSGPGIESELSDHLFEPFFTTKHKGMGMGLAISRSIVEAHNGKLWSTTNPESGASFHFTLPIAKEDKSHGK